MRTLIHNPLLLITLLLCSALQCAQAADTDRLLIVDSEGFYTSLPNVSDVTVTQHLLEAQLELKIRLADLEQQLKRKSFKAIDTLITVIMPGGLIYAKLRLDSYKRSEQALALVNAELDQISGDLVAFQTESGELMVAVAQ
jgi:hypothetical protein